MSSIGKEIEMICPDCQTEIHAAFAKFCPRCGQALSATPKTPGSELSDPIIVDEIIVLLRMYGEASGAIAMLRETHIQIERRLRTAGAVGDATKLDAVAAALNQ